MNRSAGQVLVEYMLLLMITISIASLLVSKLVSRNPDNPGYIVQKWIAIEQSIGADLPDKCETAGGNKCSH